MLTSNPIPTPEQWGATPNRTILLPPGFRDYYAYCMACRLEVAEAMRKCMASGGVQEYHIGSRGLKRYTLKDLQDLYAFWTNEANTCMDFPPSSIQCRRGIPCDV
jgi:hypothetical protein